MWNKLRDVLTFFLGFQITSFFWNFNDNLNNLMRRRCDIKEEFAYDLQAMYTSCLILLAYGSCFFSAFFWPRLNWTSSWSTKLEGNLLAFCYWRKFLYLAIFNTTFFHWPFSTLLSGRVSLGNIFAFFFIDIFTISCIISDIMLFISMK